MLFEHLGNGVWFKTEDGKKWLKSKITNPVLVIVAIGGNDVDGSYIVEGSREWNVISLETGETKVFKNDRKVEEIPKTL